MACPGGRTICRFRGQGQGARGENSSLPISNSLAPCPSPLAPYSFAMLHYFKFRQDLFDPSPAREAYVKRGAGRGWPEECPPIRAANAFGFDLLANFDVTFIQG